MRRYRSYYRGIRFADELTERKADIGKINSIQLDLLDVLVDFGKKADLLGKLCEEYERKYGDSYMPFCIDAAKKLKQIYMSARKERDNFARYSMDEERTAKNHYKNR